MFFCVCECCCLSTLSLWFILCQQVKRSYTQAQSSDKKPSSLAWPTHPTTVYVTGLPLEMTHEQLMALFEGFGAIEEARLVVDKRTQKSKGTALVQYREEQSVDGALSMDGQKVEHGEQKHTISVTRSRFPAAQPTSSSERIRPVVETKVKLTDFAPRVISRKPVVAAVAAKPKLRVVATDSVSSTSKQPTATDGSNDAAVSAQAMTNDQFRNFLM